MKEKQRSYYDKSETRKKTGYTGKILIFVSVAVSAIVIYSCSKNKFYDPSIGDPLKVAIAAIVPSNLADSVFLDPVVSVTFKSDVDPAVVASSSITVKNGTSLVNGTMSLSDTTASFLTESDLVPETDYTATVKTDHQITSGNSAVNEYSWKFRTGKKHRISSLAVVSVSPSNNSTSVIISTPVIITFNQELSSAMMSSISVILKRGTANIAGAVTFTGKTIIFQPGVNLTAGTLYAGTVLIATNAGQENGDKGSGTSHAWSFTTAGSAPDVTAPLISSVVPTNNATSVGTGTNTTVTFSEAMNPSTITSSTFTLKQGSNSIPGTVIYSGVKATFTPTAPLASNTLYTGTISTGAKDVAGNALTIPYVWNFTTATSVDVTPPTVLSVVPATASSSASTSTKATVTFSEAMNPSTLSTATFTLKQGTVAVSGTVAYSGTTATFTPSAALKGNTVYTGAITTGAKDVAGNALGSSYSWTFTTAAAADVTPPAVLAITPAANATSVAVNSKATVTFSEVMDASTISNSTFTLKQGSASVSGSVAYSGTTATFTPSSALVGNTFYTCTLTTGAKDVSGNALSANYSWSFTTAVPSDVTPPNVTSVTPANSTTSVALNSIITAVFSEAMNPAMMNTSTFTVKQGTTIVAGAVTYAGTTATFTPSSALAGNTLYNCTISTGVKDIAGNAMASAYSWSFTTVAPVPSGKSFAADIVPILNLCNTCHTHPWTPSTTASTFYASLLSGGYVNPTTPTSGKIYVKLNGGHPSGTTVSAAQVTTILTWITEGSKNN